MGQGSREASVVLNTGNLNNNGQRKTTSIQFVWANGLKRNDIIAYAILDRHLSEHIFTPLSFPSFPLFCMPPGLHRLELSTLGSGMGERTFG